MNNDQEVTGNEGTEEVIAAHAQSFMVHPFWKFFKELMEYNIMRVHERLQTEDFDDISIVHRLQDTARIYQEVLDIPDNVIERNKTNSPEDMKNALDPYQTIEEFRADLVEKRKKA